MVSKVEDVQDLPIPIGIDLGNSFSRVGAFDIGTESSKLILNEDGHSTTPTVLAFTETELVIGFDALEQAIENPENTIDNFLRLIGRSLDEPHMAQFVKTLPYKTERNHNNQIVISTQFKGQTKKFLPEELLAMFLKNLKNQADEFLSQKTVECTIVVPVCFNSKQRMAVKTAAELADLKVQRLLNT